MEGAKSRLNKYRTSIRRKEIERMRKEVRRESEIDLTPLSDIARMMGVNPDASIEMVMKESLGVLVRPPLPGRLVE